MSTGDRASAIVYESLGSPVTPCLPLVLPPKQPVALVVLVCLLSGFCNGLFLNVRGPCVHAIADLAGISTAHVGFFFIASGVGGVIAALPTGAVLDRIGSPMVVLATGLGLRAVSCVALLSATRPVPLVLVGALQGLTLPLVGIPLRAAILWTFRTSPTPYLNMVMAAFGLGSTLAPLVFDALGGGGGALHRTFWGLAGFSAVLGMGAAYVGQQLGPEKSATKEEGEDASSSGTEIGGVDEIPVVLSFWQNLRFFGTLNLYLAMSVGVEGTIGSWLYTLAGGSQVASGFSLATWVNVVLWGSFTASRLALAFLSAPGGIAQEHILYIAHGFCLGGTLCGVLAYSSAGADNDLFPRWALWTLAVAFGLGIAPSFPNVIGLANRLYPRKFSGWTQSFFGVSANAGNGALSGIAGLLSDAPGIGDVAFVWVPLAGVVLMQLLLWLLLYVSPRTKAVASL